MQTPGDESARKVLQKLAAEAALSAQHTLADILLGDKPNPLKKLFKQA